MNKHQTVATIIFGFLIAVGVVFAQIRTYQQEAAAVKTQEVKKTEAKVGDMQNPSKVTVRATRVINDLKELPAAQKAYLADPGVTMDFSKEVSSSASANKAGTGTGTVIVKSPDKIYLGGGVTDYSSTTTFLIGQPDGWMTQNNGASFSQLSTYASWGTPSTMPAPFFGRTGANSVYFKNKLWTFGGTDGTFTGNNCPNNIWSSVNGTNWKLEKTNAAWTGRTEASVVVFNNELYMIGGSKCLIPGTSISTDEVWKTADGINWTLVPPSSKPFPRRTDAAVVVYHGAIHVLGGYSAWGATGFHNTDVSSTDGVNWTVTNTPWAGRSDLGATVLNDKIYISGGVSSSQFIYPMVPFAGSYAGSTIYSDVWSYKENPLTGSIPSVWKQETANALFGTRESHSMITANNAMYVMGGTKQFAVPYTADDIYVSTDGASWKLITHSPTLLRSHFEAVTLPGSFGVSNAIVNPLVNSIQATSTTNSVTLSGSVDPKGQPNTTAWFWYNVIDIQGNILGLYETPHVPITSPMNPFTLNISGLGSQNTVSYRVVSENDSGRVMSPLYNQATRGCDPTFTNPYLVLLYPNGGETFTAGQTVNVQWESCNMPLSDIIEIKLGTLGNISVSGNDGSQQITIPAYNGYRSLTIQKQGSVTQDISNSNFLIQ